MWCIWYSPKENIKNKQISMPVPLNILKTSEIKWFGLEVSAFSCGASLMSIPPLKGTGQ